MAMPTVLAAGRSRRPVQPEGRVGHAACSSARAARCSSSDRSGAARPMRAADRSSRARCCAQPKWPASVDPHRLERSPPTREPLVVGEQHRLIGVDEPSARRRRQRREAHRSARSSGRSPRPPARRRRSCRVPHRPDALRSDSAASLARRGAPIARRSGSALTHDSAISASGIRIPDDAPADPEVDAPLRDRERADRQREIEVTVAVDATERTHRRAATDRLDLGDQVDRRDLRSARDRPAGERRAEELRQPDARPAASPRPSRPCARHPRARGSPSARASARSRARRRARGRCARGRRSSRARRASLAEPRELARRARRARPLDRARPHAAAAPREEELG